MPWRDNIGWSQDLLDHPMYRDVIVHDDDEAAIGHVLAQRWLCTKWEAPVRIKMTICTRTRQESVGSRGQEGSKWGDGCD